MRYDSSNVDLWKKKQSNLNDTLALTKQKLEAQNAKLKEAEEALRVGAIGESEFKKVQRGVMYTEAEINKLNNELGKTDKELTKLANAKWDKLASIGSTLTKSITLPVIGATTALAGMSLASINTVDEIGDNASKVFLTAEAYQEWSYACQILAVDQEKLNKAFVRVNKLLGEIANGDIDQVNKKLSLIGLTADDLAGLDTDKAFDLIRNSISKLGTEAEKAAVANQIFGDKLGAELTQVLSASSSEIENLRNEAKELGIVTTEDTQKAGDFNDKLDKLKKTLQKVQFEIASALLHLLNSIVDTISIKIVPAIRSWIDGWNNLSSSTKTIIGVLTGFLVALGPILTIVGKLIPLIASIKTAFTATAGAVTIAGTAVKLSTLGWVGLIAALAIILLQNEKFRALLGRIIEVLQKLLAKVMDMVGELIDGLMPILNVVVDLLDEIIDVLVDALEPVLDVIIKLLDPIMKLVGSIIKVISKLLKQLAPLLNIFLKPILFQMELISKVLEFLTPILESVCDILANILAPVLEVIFAILEPFIDVLSAIIDAIKWIFDNIFGVLDSVGESFTSFSSTFMGSLGGAVDWVSNKFGGFFEWVSCLFTGFTSWLGGLVEGINGFFGSVINNVSNWITNAVSSVSNWLSNAWDSVVDWCGKAVDSVGNWFGDVGESIGNWFDGAVDTVGGWFNDVGDWFSDTFNLGGGSTSSTTNNNQTTNTTNNVTVNTTASTFDVDSINMALGGNYL